MNLSPELTPEDVRSLIGPQGTTILEIGANDGSDTLRLARSLPMARIVCFECDPRAAAIWRARLDGYSRAKLIEVALADKQGALQFFPSGGRPPGWDSVLEWNKSGSLLRPDRHVEYAPWLRFHDPIDVEAITLDQAIDGLAGVIDFAWVDVQGAEAMVLRGGQNTIKRLRWWYCECHTKPFYLGQATLPEIASLLPSFSLQSMHAGDNYLFRNNSL